MEITRYTKNMLLRLAFPTVDNTYGAPRGRMSTIPSDKASEPVQLSIVKSPWVDHDYDSGGAYWGGMKGTNSYCGYHDSGIKVYVRASGISDATDRITDLCPPNTVTF